MLKFIVPEKLEWDKGQRTKKTAAEASAAKLISEFLIISGKVVPWNSFSNLYYKLFSEKHIGNRNKYCKIHYAQIKTYLLLFD